MEGFLVIINLNYYLIIILTVEVPLSEFNCKIYNPDFNPETETASSPLSFDNLWVFNSFPDTSNILNIPFLALLSLTCATPFTTGFCNKVKLALLFLTSSVDKLFTKKLLQRNECPNDRRSVNVIITDKGLELLKSLDYIDELAKQNTKSLTQDEINTLNDLLDKLRD